MSISSLSSDDDSHFVCFYFFLFLFFIPLVFLFLDFFGFCLLLLLFFIPVCATPPSLSGISLVNPFVLDFSIPDPFDFVVYPVNPLLSFNFLFFFSGVSSFISTSSSLSLKFLFVPCDCDSVDTRAGACAGVGDCDCDTPVDDDDDDNVSSFSIKYILCTYVDYLFLFLFF